MGVRSPRRKNKVKKRRQIMRGLVLSGLLACAHGLGDTFPYLNTAGHVWDVQTTGEWTATGSQCITGTKQSPIDIVSTAAATPQWTPVRLLPKDLTRTDLSLGKLPELQEATPLQSLLKLPTQALEGLPCFSEDLLKLTMPSPTLSSTLGRLRAQYWVQSTRSTG